MSNTIAITGNLTATPTVHPNAETGRVTTVFDMGDNHRSRDTETGEWRDEPAVFWHVLVFGQLAENVANSLHRGDEVTVTGRVVDDSFTGEDGATVRRLAIRAEKVDVSLRWATVEITRNPKAGQDQAA